MTSKYGKDIKAPVIRPVNSECCPGVSNLMTIILGFNKAIISQRRAKHRSAAKAPTT